MNSTQSLRWRLVAWN